MGFTTQKGRHHHQWSGGLRSITSVDQALDLPRQNQLEMKLWIGKNIVVNEITMCWEWQKRLDKDGYAQINIKGTVTFAHRLSWVLYNNKPLGSLQVLHKCDNARCVNPAHIFSGTHEDNMKDAARKGKFKRMGKTNNNYKHGKYCRA